MHDYKGASGHGFSRVPRKTMWRRGTQFGWEGALAPGTVGGRKAHPPKSEKLFKKKININERRKAIRSALNATLIKELLLKRNHILPKNFPLFLENKFEDLSKTKEVEQVLNKLGLEKELERLNVKKVRAGKGKLRGRKYRKKRGLLIVVGDDCKLLKSGKNILGIELTKVRILNTEKLAPDACGGRLTIFTEKALEIMEKENLFMNRK
ncbi:50S ribosomal protein L4 [archaeon]|nr:50S ribosomal protein L4 [archaeon]